MSTPCPRLDLREYFLYDPKGEYLDPPLQGMGLRGGGYTPLVPSRMRDGAWGLWSEVLGLYLHRRGRALRLRDPATGRDLLTHREETIARQAAEARIAELEALLSSKGIPVPPQPRCH